jgi:hypothetical protein
LTFIITLQPVLDGSRTSLPYQFNKLWALLASGRSTSLDSDFDVDVAKVGSEATITRLPLATFPTLDQTCSVICDLHTNCAQVAVGTFLSQYISFVNAKCWPTVLLQLDITGSYLCSLLEIKWSGAVSDMIIMLKRRYELQ